MNEGERAVFEETADYYENKYWRIADENKHLKQQLHKKNKEINKLKRIINKKNKKDKKDKQFYKNGARGSYKNGG